MICFLGSRETPYLFSFFDGTELRAGSKDYDERHG